MNSCEVDYQPLIDGATRLTDMNRINYWQENLPIHCVSQYLAVATRPTEILRVSLGTFEYVFDSFQTPEQEGSPPNGTSEGRLVIVCGRSQPQARERDDRRLRGWVGRTSLVFGSKWDKGHFIGHSLGGAVDGWEMNVFVQRRDLNRGWSNQGKLYRKMGAYCAQNPGAFCFSRPLYADVSSRPAFLDFGVLTKQGSLWVQRFDNR